MKPINFKKLLPHIVAVALFLVVAILYCKPALEGKVLYQHDTMGWKGMAQQSFESKEKTGHFPLWTNSMFGGMPTYQIAMDPGTNAGKGIEYFAKIINLGLPAPISYFFLSALCFYFLCVVLRLNPWAAIIGGFAYAFATYNPIIITVGHISKMLSMAYAPAVLAGLSLLFQRKYLAGFVTTAVFATILIAQNHLQVVYYTLLIAGCMAVAYIIKSIREGQLLDAAKASVIGLVAGLIGLGVCAVNILPTYEYSKETMRGGISKLTLNNDQKGAENKTKGGLDKDYALRWSLGKMESFVVMVPGLYGGSNGGNEHSTSALTESMGFPEENAVALSNRYSYWGNMAGETTSGPPYLGAVICFLFILGLFYVTDWNKWWILAATLIGLFLAWGNSFQSFNYFMLDYLPFYNKFRAPSMAMVITQLTIPLLASYTVSKLLEGGAFAAENWKRFRNGLIAAGAVMAVLALFYFTTDYTTPSDTALKENIKQNFMQQSPNKAATPELVAQAEDGSRRFMKAIREDRKSLLGGDLLRTFLLVLLAAGLSFAVYRKKINGLVFAIGIFLLCGYDLISIDKKYLSYDSFREADEINTEAFTPTAADQVILKDPDHANFRVFNQASDFTQESTTSYFHNSIGGYSPAKLGLYQDLLEHQIIKGNIEVLNMLNTKYVIMPDQNGRPVAQLNPGAFGTCWLVKGIKFVNGADAEMLALDSTNLRDTAVVDNEFKAAIKQLPQYDSAATIKLKERQNDAISYTFSGSTPQFAVFSEIYYPRGWNAFIDGQKAGYVKVNYVLRGLALPAGNHTIEFRFEPQSYELGKTLSFWSAILIYLVVAGGIAVYFIRRKKEQAPDQNAAA